MTSNASNPFRKLADMLASHEEQAESSAAGSGSVPAKAKPSARPAAPRPAGRKHAAPAAEDEEAALFLQAVSSATPLNDAHHGAKGNPRSARSDAHASFADLFETSGSSSRKNPDASSGQAENRTSTGKKNKKTASGVTSSTAPPAPGRNPDEQEMSMAEALAAQEGPPPGSDDHLFTSAMRGVSPIAAKGRELAAPVAAQAGVSAAPDPAQALRDLLEGKVEFALHHTDEYMEGHVVGLDPLIMNRLRAGQFSPETHLDLHGQNAQQAYDSLSWFIKNAYQRGMRTVIVVTGRGKNSPDGVGVLRPMLQQWLSKDPFKRVVLAFCTAKSSDGGPGAFYVLLRKYKKTRGKIVWEHAPSNDDFPDS